MTYGNVPHLAKPVSRIVAGTDYLTHQAPHQSYEAYDAFWEGGGRAFDTAYGYGDNTTILGGWIRSRDVADEAIFFDKVVQPYNGHSLMRREGIRKELDRNQRLLGVKKTDLCVFHRDDETVPIGEIVDWMNELIGEGRIDGFGGSNWRWERIREGNAYAERAGKQGFSLSNPTLSLAVAQEAMWTDCITLDEGGKAWHEETQFPLFLWSSTARGYFARVEDKDVARVYDNEANRGRRDRAEILGTEKGLSPVQIALAYVLSLPMNTFALCGMRTKEQAVQNSAAADVQLTTEEIAYLATGAAR